MNPKEAIKYLTHESWRRRRPGLERIGELLQHMGNPQHRLKFIHIAGTNGKGSIAAMLSSIMVQAGYVTGLYTSPYVRRFNERIQVNGVPIPDNNLAEVTGHVKAFADIMADHPTEFELITAIAIAYFEQSGCDIVVFETGMGGRLDATNIIPVPEAAVITSIGLDHVAQLGDTLEMIATEKGGIIKQGGDVVLYPQAPGVEGVIETICMDRKACLTRVCFDSLCLESSTLSGHIFSFQGLHGLRLPLLGIYQPGNAAAALSALSVLRNKGWNISNDSIYKGLGNTQWPARFELIGKEPYVVVDGGHNPQCVESVVASLQYYFPAKKVIFLAGVMAEKDYNAMFDIALPFARMIITVTPNSPRALPASDLARHLHEKGFADAAPCNSIIEGVKLALSAAGGEDVICAFGSLYIVGEIRAFFGRYL